MSRLVFLRCRDANSTLFNALLSETKLAGTSTKLIGTRCCYSSGKESSRVARNSGVKGQLNDEESGEKKVVLTRILLLNTDKKILNSVTLEEAQLIARRRNLSLVKVNDANQAKHKQEVYQLFASVDKPTAREEKALTIGAKIGEHDLEIRLKAMQKWFSKGYIVKIVINSINSMEEGENIFSKIQKEAVEANYKAVQKQIVADAKIIKFTLQPDKKKAAQQTQQTAKVDVPKS